MDVYVPIIPPEDLVHIVFTKSLVQEKRNRLKKKLVDAMKNGNTNKIKYRIFFETQNGLLSVITTIWFVGKEYILVKGNIAIPISSINEIKI